MQFLRSSPLGDPPFLPSTSFGARTMKNRTGLVAPARSFQPVLLGWLVVSTAPVLDAQPGHTCHVIEVCRHQRGIDGQGVRSDGRIEILDPCSPSFQ